MVVVGDNLRSLLDQYRIVDGANCFDDYSLTLHLDKGLKLYKPPEGAVLTYEEQTPADWVQEMDIGSGFVVRPRSGILACSCEWIKMPKGYMGLIQTKGSLARLLVAVHCGDGQVDPGFSGKLTFEICNFASFSIRLKHQQPVAQLFIFKTSTRRVPDYAGRYGGASGPTLSRRHP